MKKSFDLDNFSIHKTAEASIEVAWKNIILEFIPPNSSQPNLIEEVFSCLKALIYASEPFSNKEEIKLDIIENLNGNVNMDRRFENTGR